MSGRPDWFVERPRRVHRGLPEHVIHVEAPIGASGPLLTDLLLAWLTSEAADRAALASKRSTEHLSLGGVPATVATLGGALVVHLEEPIDAAGPIDDLVATLAPLLQGSERGALISAPGSRRGELPTNADLHPDLRAGAREAIGQLQEFLGTPLAGAAASLMPGLAIIDEGLEDPETLASIEWALARTEAGRALLRWYSDDGGRDLFDTGRILTLLRPAEVELSDEWPQLATALSGRPYTLGTCARLANRYPELLSVIAGERGTLVRPASPLALAILGGGIPPSGSEHLRLFHALRARAIASISSRDSSDQFVAEQIPRQAAASEAFGDLFLDPLTILASDLESLVTEIEASKDLVLNLGAKVVLLGAARMRDDDPGARASHLELESLRVGLTDFSASIAMAFPMRPWRAVWAKSKAVHTSRTIAQSTGSFTSVAAMPGGEVLVAASDGHVAVLGRSVLATDLDLSGSISGGEVRAIGGGVARPGPYVVVGTSADHAVAADLESGAVRWDAGGTQGGPISRVAIAPEVDAPVLVGGVGGRVVALDPHTGTPLDAWTYEHGAEVRALAWATCGGREVVAFGAVDGQVGLLLGSDQVVLLAVDRGVVNDLAVRPGPTGLEVLAATADGWLADVRFEGTPDGPVAAELTWTAPVTRAAINGIDVVERAGRRSAVVALADQTWMVLELGATGPTGWERRIEGHFGPINDLCATTRAGDVFVVTASGDGAARCWHLDAVCDESLELERSTRHRGAVTATALLPTSILDGGTAVATGGSDGDVRLWSVDQAGLGTILVRAHRRVTAIDAQAGGDDNLVVVGSADGALKLHRQTTGNPAIEAVLGMVHDGITGACIFERDGEPMAIACGNDGGASMWNLSTMRQEAFRQVMAFGAATCATALHDPGGRTLAAIGGQQGAIELVDAHTLAGIDRHEFTSSVLSCAPLSVHRMGLALGLADGRIALARDLAWAHEGTWEYLGAHEREVTGVQTLVVGGRLVLASASLDRTLRIWDLSTRMLLLEVAFDGQLLSLDSLGNRLAVGTSAGASVIELHGDPLVLSASRPPVRSG